jgi:hypothetical protein
MSALPHMSEALLITYTLFPDVQPVTKTERADVPWETLVNNIRNAPTYISKSACPLISIGEYGDVRSEKDCLRHAANVRRIFGIEIDYDGEQMPVEEAAAILQNANICAVLYTSPSHTVQRPRWRALLPLSEPALPDKRREYVARANRVLNGVATRESFTLSQSFYLGRVRGAEYIVIETHGRYIDLAAEIEPLYFVGGSNDGESVRDATTDTELRDCFNRGQGRYEAMLKLSSRWAARGLPADDIETSLLELLGSGYMNHDGIDLRTRARPMAVSAVAKFGETRQPQHIPHVSNDSAPQVATPDQTPKLVTDELKLVFHQATESSFVKIKPRQFLYRRHYMRKMLGVTAAAGGAGKSSVVLVELISMAIGRDLLNGGEPLKAGRQVVWYHNGEDPEDEIRRRLAAILSFYEITWADIASYFVWTVGRESPLIVAHDIKGETIISPRTIEIVVGHVLERKIAVICLDPLVSTHRVSENSNDAMEVVTWQWRQVADQTEAAIEAIHHFRKSNGQEPSVDDIRGASSLIGAARSARLFATMSRDEAATAGIDPRERRRFLWESQAKANMYVAADERLWRELNSVDLENAEDPYESDKVGVASHWDFPNTMTSLADEYFGSIMSAIRGCSDPMKRRLSVSSSGWVGNLIATVVGADTKDQTVRKQIAAQVRQWQDRGVLNVVKVWDPRQGREVDCLAAADRVN